MSAAHSGMARVRTARVTGDAECVAHLREKLVLPAPGGDLLACLGILGGVTLGGPGTLRIEPAIDQPMQLELRPRPCLHCLPRPVLSAHFTTRSLAGTVWCVSCRSASLPRESRDMTVPIGTPCTSATSR